MRRVRRARGREAVAVEQLQRALDDSFPNLLPMMRPIGHAHPRNGAELSQGEICWETYDHMFLINLPDWSPVHAEVDRHRCRVTSSESFSTPQRADHYLDQEKCNRSVIWNAARPRDGQRCGRCRTVAKVMGRIRCQICSELRVHWAAVGTMGTWHHLRTRGFSHACR